MKITNKWITKNRPCKEALDWWDKKERDSSTIIKKLISEKRYSWCNWLFLKIMTRDQKIRYAIYAAEAVIDIYEKKYPSDKRPRKAIKAAKDYLKNPSDKNIKNAVYAAVVDAYAAAAAAAVAAYADAAYAPYAAYAAADATYAVADATYAAADAAYAPYAAYAANAAFDIAGDDRKLLNKMIKYGIKLLK